MRNIFTFVSLVFGLAAMGVSARNVRKEHRFRPRQNGSCGSPEIQFGTGLDGNTAPTFKPVNQKDFPHGAATDLSTITSFICQRMQSPCNAASDVVAKCQQAANSLSGQTGGQAADRWNADFGVSTNYSGTKAESKVTTTTTTTTTPAAQPTPTTTTATTTTAAPQAGNPSSSSSSTTTTPPASGSQGVSQELSQSVTATSGTATTTGPSSDGIDVDGLIKNNGCALQAILVTVTLPADSATGTSKPNVLVPISGFNALDLGTCTDPTVAFGQGLGGRSANEWAFMNNNIAQFPHGSTLDLPTILQFTCDNLVNRCGLSTNSATVAACNNAEAEGAKYGNTGLGADIFNRGMGFSTYYAAVDGS